MEEEEFVFLSKVKAHWKWFKGKRVFVKEYEDNRDSRHPSQQAAEKTAEWWKTHGQALSKIERDKQAFNAKHAQDGKAHKSSLEQNIPVHVKEQAEDMSDKEIMVKALKIRQKDEDDLTPLERAIMGQVSKRGIKLNVKFSHELNAWWK